MAMEYFLKQINPANPTPLIICLDTDEMTIGRRSIVSLTGFNKVSRKHAKFLNKNGRWFVRDLESLNKLYVNFKEVDSNWIPLEIGDIIGFGTPSYIEDGGLVCVFAAKSRIKQEPFDVNEFSSFGTKNNETVQNVIDVKSRPIKQELSPNNDADYQMEIVLSKPSSTFQTNASPSLSGMLNNASNNNLMNYSDIYDPNSVTEFQNKFVSEDIKPKIKTEPIENDDNDLISSINTSTLNLPINLKLNIENTDTHDNPKNTCEVITSLKNNIDDIKQPPTKMKKPDTFFNKQCEKEMAIDQSKENNKQLRVTISPTKSLSMNQKPNVDNMSVYDFSDSDNTSTSEVKFSLRNIFEERKQPIYNDVSSKTKEVNKFLNENCTEVVEKTSLDYSIPEKKIIKSSVKLQAMIQKAKDIKEEKMGNMLPSDYCKKVAVKTDLNDSVPEKKLEKMRQKAKGMKCFHNRMNDCRVKLVKCDSKYFRWPPEIHFSRLLASIDEDVKAIQKNDREIIRKQTSETHLKRKKFKESIEENKTVKVALNLKVSKNRILSSSSEMSSDESEFEKKDANISSTDTPEKRKTEKKSKKPHEVKKSLDTSRRNSSSIHENSRALKISGKRKPSFDENHSLKRIKRNKGNENLSNSNDLENVVSPSSASASGKPVDIRKKVVQCYSRDESFFYVQRNPFCSKYWTPEYNEFENGEVQERFKLNTFTKPKQTAGRTLLTDPKPMEYRSRKMRGREEWFQENSKYSSKDSGQNEKISEDTNEETSCSSRNFSKSSLGQRFVSSKEYSSTVNQRISTELSCGQVNASSKENAFASQKNPTELISMETFATDENISIFHQKFSTELPLSQAIASSKGNFSVSSRKHSSELFSDKVLLASNGSSSVASWKNPTEKISIPPFVSSKTNTLVVNRKTPTKLFSNEELFVSSENTSVHSLKSSTELIPRDTFALSPEHISNVNSEFPTEQPSNQTIAQSTSTSVASRKNSEELFTIQPFATSRVNASVAFRKYSRDLSSDEALLASSEGGNILIASRKNPLHLFSDEALLASTNNLAIGQRKNSLEVISSASVALSRENPPMENLEQSMQDNSALFKSTADTIRINTPSSVFNRRNSLGSRTRFLVEIQTNADEASKNKGKSPKETIPQLAKTGSLSIMMKPTEIINTSAFPTLEATKNEKEISKNVNNILTRIGLSHRISSLPVPIFNSSFEDKKELDWNVQETKGENKLSTYDLPPEKEPKLTIPITKRGGTQFSQKEMLDLIFNNLFENKQMNSKEQAIRENELPAHKLSDTTPIIEQKLRSPTVKTTGTQYLPKEVFSKNDKNSSDKKVAIVSPVSHESFQRNSLSQSDPAPHFQAAVEEKITNRAHSTYILSPIKQNSKPLQPNSESSSVKNAPESAPDTKFHSRYLIKNITQWNPKWLEEQAKNKKPPPMVSKGGLVLPLRYSSYDSYIKSFYPMISLEIWEGLFRESKHLWLKKEVKNAFHYIVRSNRVQHGFMELQCESVVNENLSFLPCEGNIVLLGFNDTENGLENSLFGYIHCHKIESALETEKMEEWLEVPKEWLEKAKIWTFSLYIKKSKKNFTIGSVSLAHGISNIKSKLLLVDALAGFKDSPIQDDILRPTKEMFSFCKSISKISRAQLIQTVSEEIKKENPHSKLILINAPVATGKTGAIIGIVEKLLFSNASKAKILLCASSDLTVDEIGLRLVELNERCSWRGNCIKFVRFGEYESIPAKLQEYTLKRKVLKMFKEQNKKIFEEREKELKVLEDKINNVLFQEQLKTNNKYRYRKSNGEALKQLTSELQSLKDKSPDKNIDPFIQATYKSVILNESNLVLATLNSCMDPLMRKFYTSCKDEAHACCIIDEISQCTELEVLQCLHPEINRLVLVGDLQQLQPHVSSKFAINWGFKRSMLERILKLFNAQFSCAPPLTMAEQHRMHSQICHFPSKYFYKDELLTAANVDERFQFSPLRPYVVYDILEKEILNPPVNIEDNEPFIIANICAQFLQAVPTASLGVIVPHEDLATLYKIPLSLGNAALKGIEVNTVENYQGIERDIIIISCINPSLFVENDNFLSCEKKMNVAITRARQSLIICGHISLLTQFEHWVALINDAKLRKSFISISSLRQIPFVIMKTICKIG